MPAWTDYTSKTTPADTDEVMIKDFSDSNKANKRMLFSGLWNWIVNKLTNAVIANLETSPQTIVGAINSLNSNTILPKSTNIESDNTIFSLSPGSYSVTDNNNITPTGYGILDILYTSYNYAKAIWTSSNKKMYVRMFNRNTKEWLYDKWMQIPTEDYSILTTSAKTSLVSAVNEVNGKFKVVSYTSETLNIPSNTGGYIQINSIIPSGYIPIGVTVANSSVPGGTVFVLASISKTANENFINYFNRHTETTLTTTLTFEIICIKK